METHAGTGSIPGDIIDRATFQQLLDMDEADNIFSKGLVDDYREQADTTFKEMDTALGRKDLTELSQLGHFLKGSSAAIGLKKVQSSCEKIQNYGSRKGPAGEPLEASDEDLLKKIKEILAQARKENTEAAGILTSFYEQI